MQDQIDAILRAQFTQTIDGQPVATVFEDVVDPAKDAPFQKSPAATDAEIDMAVSAARRAQPAWEALSWDQREAYLRKLAALLEDNAAYLAPLLTMEQGMPLTSAHFSLAYAAESLRTFAAIRLADQVLVDDAQRVVTQSWKALGVVAAIAPWNHPLVLGFQKVGNALIAGNTVVLKPSEQTPLTTLEIGRLSREILPPGVLNVIGGGRSAGQALVSHAGIDKISFTGSTATGVAIARESSRYLRPMTLELGGNDAAILLPDGSIPALVAMIIQKSLGNRGQYCAAIKRVYVPTAMHDTFCEALVTAAEAIRIGNGFEPDVEMGPIQNKLQFDKICAYVEDAKAAGGTVLTGGAPLDREGYFYPPTVITGLTPGAKLVDEEQFGPLMPVLAYDDLDRVIEQVNQGPYGLTGSVWTADIARGNAIAGRLQVGTGWVNQHGNFDLGLPFPLIKASGVGYDFADLGVKGSMRMQVIHALRG